MPSAIARVLLIGIALLVALGACQREAETPQDTPSSQSASAHDIPLGQLPADVQPLAYQLELTIIPELEEFSGKTTIDLDISTARDHFYLHGKNIEARSVRISDGASTYDGHYEQVDASGIVRIIRAQADVGQDPAGN